MHINDLLRELLSYIYLLVIRKKSKIYLNMINILDTMIASSIFTILSVLIISLGSIVAAIPLLIKKKILKTTQLFLLSFSVGVLLSTVFIGLLPEAVAHGYDLSLGLNILSGFLVMFVLEKFVHFHHSKKHEHDDCGHSHAYSMAPVNLIGDAVHNFIDGMVVAGSYAVSITLGITTTISVLFHELPQEIADFGVLLYSGLSKKKALWLNFISALTSMIGAVIGIVLAGRLHGFTEFVLPFAAGNFLYISASNLLPELHRHCKLKDTFYHLLAILLGILLIILVSIYSPGHVHA